MNNTTTNPFSDLDSIWNIAPVIDEPETILIRWNIVKMKNGSAHFVGYSMQNREGRVSSTIIDFDPNTRRGRTRSGRIYELKGSAGIDPDAEYVLGRWLGLQNLTRDDILEYDTLDE